MALTILRDTFSIAIFRYPSSLSSFSLHFFFSPSPFLIFFVPVFSLPFFFPFLPSRLSSFLGRIFAALYTFSTFAKDHGWLMVFNLCINRFFSIYSANPPPTKALQNWCHENHMPAPSYTYSCTPQVGLD